MNVRRFNIRQGLQWITCGWRFSKKELRLWWLLGLIYVTMAIVLTRIPVIGLLLVYFITPLLAASSMLAMQKMRAGNIAAADKPQSLAAQLAAALLSIFSEIDKILVIIGLSTVCLVLGMVIQLVGQAVGGSAMLSPAGLLDLGAEAALRVISAHVVMNVLTALIVIILALALPLFVSGKNIGDSLTGAMAGFTKNIVPIAIYALILLGPVFCIALIMQASFFIGAPLALLVSSALLALLLNSSYCIFKLMFH